MWVGHEKRCARNTLKVKRSKVNVKMVMRRSSTKQQVLLNKRQIYGGAPKLHWYPKP